MSMKRVMEHLRWELDNWWAQRYGRERWIVADTKKAVNFIWQSWKRGALFILVLVCLPILFPLALFLTFLGFISSVPLLCGAATYYLLFGSFTLPLWITKWLGPIKTSLENRCPHSSPLKHCAFQNALKLNVVSEDYHKTSESEAAFCKSPPSYSNAVLQDLGPLFVLPSSNAKSQHRLPNDKAWSFNAVQGKLVGESLVCEVAGVMDNEDSKSCHQRTSTRSMVSPGKRTDTIYVNRSYAHSSSALSSLERLYAVQSLGPGIRPLRKSQSLGEHEMCFGTSEAAANVARPSREVIATQAENSTMDIPFNRLFREKSSCNSVRGTDCSLDDRHAAAMGGLPVVGTANGSYLSNSCGEHTTGNSVSIGHTVIIPSEGDSSKVTERFRGQDFDMIDNRVANRKSTDNSAVSAELTACSNMHPLGAEVTMRTVSNVPNAQLVKATLCAEALDSKLFKGRSELFLQESTPEISGHLSEKFFEETVESISTPSSYSSLLRSLEGTARADSQLSSRRTRARHWREEVEDTVVSSSIKRIACMGNRGAEASEDVGSRKSVSGDSEKMKEQDIVYLLECTEEAEALSSSQPPNAVHYQDDMVAGESGRMGSYIKITSSPCPHPRRLSFSGETVEDKGPNLGHGGPRENCSVCTPDSKGQSVSSFITLDYTWPSESPEHGWEILSTRVTAYENSSEDTVSITEQVEEEIDGEPFLVSDPSSATYPNFIPTPDQLTEDWQTRRKIWEEESTPGRLTPFAPRMEPQPVEARSMCNPLFEFATPSPPLRKLSIGDKIYNSSSPPLYSLHSKGFSAPSEAVRAQMSSADSTPSSRRYKYGKWKSSNYTERFESEVLGLTPASRRHFRSFSASFMESVQPDADQLEGLPENWWMDNSTRSLTSSPVHSPTVTSTAEVVHRLRDEINTIQMVIGKKVPPQSSLWKEVEALSQILGTALPRLEDISDLSKARQGLDLLKIIVSNRWNVEL